MAASITIYPALEEHMLRGTVVAATDPLKIALITSAYTPTDTDEVFAAASGAEIAPGNGYTAGGLTIGSATVTRTGAVTTFDLPDIDITAVGGNIPAWRYAVVYAAVTRNSKVNPILFRILGNDTGIDIPVTPANVTVRVSFNTAGVFTL